MPIKLPLLKLKNMNFKKDRLYDRKKKVTKKLLNIVRTNAKKSLKDKFMKLDDNGLYNLKDLGFKVDLTLTGKQIKHGVE